MARKRSAEPDAPPPTLAEALTRFLIDMEATAGKGLDTARAMVRAGGGSHSQNQVAYYQNALGFLGFMRGQLPSWVTRQLKGGDDAA